MRSCTDISIFHGKVTGV